MTLSTTGSQALFDRAREVIPGGVNSPVRAFRGVGGVPRFIASAEGAWLTDVDGHPDDLRHSDRQGAAGEGTQDALVRLAGQGS